jgi:hypothetical protein
VSAPGSGGSISATGQLGGMSIPTSDVVGLIQMKGAGAATTATAEVAITDMKGTCGALQAVVAGGPRLANVSVLSMLVTVQGNVVDSGSYPVLGIGCAPNCPSSATGFALAAYSSTDANCNTVQSEPAISGTVALTSVTATEIQGSFDLGFATSDHVTGSFSAPVCTVGNAVDGGQFCR